MGYNGRYAARAKPLSRKLDRITAKDLQTSDHVMAQVWRLLRDHGPMTSRLIHGAVEGKTASRHATLAIIHKLRNLGWLGNGPTASVERKCSDGKKRPYPAVTWVALKERSRTPIPRVATLRPPRLPLGAETEAEYLARIQCNLRRCGARLTKLATLAHKTRYESIPANMGATLGQIEEELRQLRDVLFVRRIRGPESKAAQAQQQRLDAITRE